MAKNFLKMLGKNWIGGFLGFYLFPLLILNMTTFFIGIFSGGLFFTPIDQIKMILGALNEQDYSVLLTPSIGYIIGAFTQNKLAKRRK